MRNDPPAYYRETGEMIDAVVWELENEDPKPETEGNVFTNLTLDFFYYKIEISMSKTEFNDLIEEMIRVYEEARDLEEEYYLQKENEEC